MPEKHYFKWMIIFRDRKPPSAAYREVNDGNHYVAGKLKTIYCNINSKRKMSTTQIPCGSILSTQSDQDVDDYRFTCYFEARGGNGFGRLFFN